MDYILSSAIGYLLGSVPTGYIIIKKYRNLDITDSGSGNSGALNTYLVSESVLLGIGILALDFLKGFLSVYIAKLLFPNSFILTFISLFFATLAHCYSPWLKFKGGRGLATAAGGAVIFIPHLIFIWGFIWVIGYVYKKDMGFANSVAILLTGILVFLTKDALFKYTSPQAETPLIYGLCTGIFFLLLLSRQIEPVKQYFQKQNAKIKRNSFNEKK